MAIKNIINVSSECFDEITGALNEKGIKLDNDTEFTVKKDTAIKGPINYRQVNLRHQLLIEIVKIYKSPINDKEMEFNDAKDFIEFFDKIYQYILTGQSEIKKFGEIKKSGW